MKSTAASAVNRLLLEVWARIISHLERPLPPKILKVKWSELHQQDLAGIMTVSPLFHDLAGSILYRLPAVNDIYSFFYGVRPRAAITGEEEDSTSCNPAAQKRLSKLQLLASTTKIYLVLLAPSGEPARPRLLYPPPFLSAPFIDESAGDMGDIESEPNGFVHAENEIGNNEGYIERYRPECQLQDAQEDEVVEGVNQTDATDEGQDWNSDGLVEHEGGGRRSWREEKPKEKDWWSSTGDVLFATSFCDRILAAMELIEDYTNSSSLLPKLLAVSVFACDGYWWRYIYDAFNHGLEPKISRRLKKFGPLLMESTPLLYWCQHDGHIGPFMLGGNAYLPASRKSSPVTLVSHQQTCMEMDYDCFPFSDSGYVYKLSLLHGGLNRILLGPRFVFELDHLNTDDILNLDSAINHLFAFYDRQRHLESSSAATITEIRGLGRSGEESELDVYLPIFKNLYDSWLTNQKHVPKSAAAFLRNSTRSAARDTFGLKVVEGKPGVCESCGLDEGRWRS
ncbi:hypothetical protein P7C73_g3779, partial [Tremellales sp. Uapishka_1]